MPSRLLIAGLHAPISAGVAGLPSSCSLRPCSLPISPRAENEEAILSSSAIAGGSIRRRWEQENGRPAHARRKVSFRRNRRRSAWVTLLPSEKTANSFSSPAYQAEPSACSASAYSRVSWTTAALASCIARECGHASGCSGLKPLQLKNTSVSSSARN